VTPADLLESLHDWEAIGRSVLGRPIPCKRFPGGGPPVLLKGAIHGDEPLGAFVLARLAAELAERPPARETWIVPVVNPDGFLERRKHNHHGVDLNRNFPAQNWQAEGTARYFPGLAPGSEPETRALMDLIEKIAPPRIVSLHSPYRTVNFDGPARELAERMAAKNGYGATPYIGYPTPGSFGSLYGVEFQLEVITLEIPRMSVDDAWRENRDALHEALAA
jgi:protein MpaA